MERLINGESSEVSEATCSSDQKKRISKPGKRKAIDIQFLESFFRLGKRWPVKKEYLRANIIRSHRRFFYYYNREKIRKELDHLGSTPKGECLRALVNLYKIYNKMFKKLPQPMNSKRARGRKDVHRSFSQAFCYEYFLNERVRQSFFYYTEYLFNPFEPEKLARQFGMRCCMESSHTVDCEERWGTIKTLIQETYIFDLGLTPYYPRESPGEDEEAHII